MIDKRINKEFIYKIFRESQMHREIEKIFDAESIPDFEEEFFDLVYLIISRDELFIYEDLDD